MLIIKHRVNSISELTSLPNNYGTEIDIRTNNKDLILSHDPFQNGVLLSEWMNFFNHKFIIANVKESGLEERVVQCFKNHNIYNYFFLDQSIPDLVKKSEKINYKSALRFSSYESIVNIESMHLFADWVWIDSFNNFFLDKKSYEKIKNFKKKICIVSPELINISRRSEISIFKKKIYDNKFMIDAVCTKYPDLWITE